MIVPDDAARGTLDVLAIGSLGRVPLAALRERNGSLVIARRPLARVLSLRASGPDATGGGPPVVVANPTGDLQGAEKEGAVVLGALGAGVIVLGASRPVSATRSRFFEARNAELLHVAGHVTVLGRWRALHLADGDVDPADMVEQHVAPRVAVLAGCGSAAATDEEGWGSMAAALLESGTTVVIATDRSVEDPAARTLIGEFYAQPDWRTDPTHALASVQSALDARAPGSTDKATTPQLWAAFSVLRRAPVVAGSSRAQRLDAQ